VAHRRAQPTAAAPAPNSQVLTQLRSDWQAQKDMMMKIADAMPENKFSYKSTPPQRNYGEQIMHVASSNVELLKILGWQRTGTGLLRPSEREDESRYSSRRWVYSYDYGTALLNELTETAILEPVKDPPSFLGPSSRGAHRSGRCSRTAWISTARWHVYLRLNGIVSSGKQRRVGEPKSQRLRPDRLPIPRLRPRRAVRYV
jgi:hypothetical protein